jgi:peptidoglycan hydrolase-like protein with peptidoglycan-binding domain
MADYVFRDGQRLTPYMLKQINRLDADFFAAFGLHIIVSSGIRTNADQEKIFRERYVTAGNINGRRVYDTRVWNGVTWYRISSAGTVAVPGTSNHEIQGNKAAVDIRDTGNDAGITVKGSVRGQWIRARVKNYDMVASGDGFGEGWHFDVNNIWADGGSGGGDGVWGDTEKQNFLNSLGYDTGAPGWGPKCAAATRDFQGKVGLNPDSQFGPDTTKVAITITKGGNWTNGKKSDLEIQTRLTELGFPMGPLDNQWGNKTSLGTYMFQRANGLTADAQFGDASLAKAWPPVPEPPKPVEVPGRNATSRPIGDIQKAFGIPVTNVWDLATATTVFNYQKSKFIDADYIYGVTSDGFLFPPTNFGLGVDYSFARPDLQMLKDRGHTFIARYLWKEKYDDGVRINKGLSKAEYDAAEALGFKVAVIYEEDGKELNKGLDAGIRVANEAERFRNAQGLPSKPIYFNVDYDATDAEIPAILDALRGIAQVIGLERVGLYAGYKIVKAAFDAGVISFGMQTYAWSNGQWDSRAQLRQWSNGQYGGSVDFQYAMAEEFGQTPVEIVTPPDPDPDPEPDIPVTIEELNQHREEALALQMDFDLQIEALTAHRNNAKSLVEFFDRLLESV